MSGEKRHSFGNTEPGAGSDAAGIKTSYKKVDGGYVINGHKIYNTYASCSDYNIITAKDPEIDDPYKAVTLFAIPNPTPGMTIVDLPTIGQWLELLARRSWRIASFPISICMARSMAAGSSL